MVEVTGSNPVSPNHPGSKVGVSFYTAIIDMIGNLLWLAFIGIKRRKFFSTILFIMAFLVACSLFLINISQRLLRFPDIEEMRQFFYVIIYSVLVFSILIIAAISTVSTLLRRTEYSILRIYGARRADLLFLSVLESFILCFFGALGGVLLIIILISLKLLYLPYFFEGVRRVGLQKLFGIGGQTIFAVVLIEACISIILLLLLLRKDIPDLERGA
jgi:ABC-type antimicrobial peptide transport system permease subunit